MLDPALVSALSAAKYLPVPEMRAALAEPDRIADAVLEVLGRAAQDPGLEEADANLLFWGLHVLAAVREARAFRPLVRLLYQDGETLEALLGDAMTETLSRILVSVFDGDAAPLCNLLVDSTVDEMARHEGLAALTYLTHTGRVSRDETRALLVRFDEKRAAVEGDLSWAAWEEAIALLAMRDLSPRVAASRSDGRLTGEFSDQSLFSRMLAEAEEQPDDLARFDPQRFGTLDDPILELDWTAEGFGQPVRNPWRDVGRNDPCPCGSGKKFKKCCLDKVA